MLMFIIIAASWTLIVTLVTAYPQDFNCKGSSWKGGDAFGHMLVDKFTAAKSECVIQGVPSNFTPGKKYTIKVVSNDPLGHKLVVDEGALAGDKVWGHF
jgi:hypothetical protein